jgi:hypothetical protein
MIKSKLLTDSAWKDVLAKNKGVKDNGMLKILAEIRQLGDDDHDDAQKILDQLLKLSGQLKKSKEIAAAPAVGKFLIEMASAADSALREVAKAKADAEKNAKAQADAKKREQDQKKGHDDDEDDEDEDQDHSALLTTKLLPLLRQVNKGESLHAMVASTSKQVVVMLSRKPISPARRKLLAEQLGQAGGIKYSMGHCVREAGMTTFVMKSQVAGMAKKLKLALLEQTGLRVKLRCRGEDGETDEDLDDSPEEREAQQAQGRGDRTPARGGEEGGKPETSSPESAPEVEAQAPKLEDAPQVWMGTRRLLQTNIDALKAAVRAQIAEEGDDLVDEIDGHLVKLDRIMGSLDKRLTNSLAKAAETANPADRKAMLQESKVILAEYIRYIKSESLIEHIDRNPFGVKTDLKATLSKSLMQVARAIG